MKQPSVIDTHAHLTYDNFKTNLTTLLKTYEEQGVSHVFTVGYDLESSKQCLQLAQTHKNVYAIIGIHPSDISVLDKHALAWLEKAGKDKSVIAIGEIGLDYHYDTTQKQLQKEGFVAQIKLAHKLKLPIVIHTRDASEDLLEILQENKQFLQFGGLVHCFSENLAFYHQINALGLSISLGGVITFQNSSALREAVLGIPLQSIVLETDSPYLTPVPYRGKQQNEPKFVTLVAQKLADLKQVTYTEVAHVTNANVARIFPKFKP